MREVGIDVSSNIPTLLSADLIVSNGVNVVVTMGWWVPYMAWRRMPGWAPQATKHPPPTLWCHRSGDACPYVTGVEVVAWQVPDPHGAKLDAVREIRDHLKQQVRHRGRARRLPASACLPAASAARRGGCPDPQAPNMLCLAHAGPGAGTVQGLQDQAGRLTSGAGGNHPALAVHQQVTALPGMAALQDGNMMLCGGSRQACQNVGPSCAARL